MGLDAQAIVEDYGNRGCLIRIGSGRKIAQRKQQQENVEAQFSETRISRKLLDFVIIELEKFLNSILKRF